MKISDLYGVNNYNEYFKKMYEYMGPYIIFLLYGSFEMIRNKK